MNTTFEEITNASKASYEAIQKLTDINTTTLNELATIQMNLANISFESGLAQFKLVSNIKDYNEFISAEAQFASEVQDKVIKIAEQASAVISSSQDEVTNWFSNELPKMTEFDSVIPEEPKKPVTKRKVSKAKTKAKSKAS